MAAPWATRGDVVDYLAGGGYTPPSVEDAPRVLARAWSLVEDYTVPGYDPTLILDVDTGWTIADALAQAVCAQIEQWAEVGEDNDIAGFPRDTFASTGISVNRLPDVLAPRAARALRKAGLLSAVPAGEAPRGVELI